MADSNPYSAAFNTATPNTGTGPVVDTNPYSTAFSASTSISNSQLISTPTSIPNSIPTPTPVDTSKMFTQSSKPSILTSIKNFFSSNKPSSPVFEAPVGAGMTPDQTSKAYTMLQNQPETPGQTIKAPFMDIGTRVPSEDGIGAGYSAIKSLVETPEKAVRSVTEALGITKPDSEIRKAQYTVPSYGEVAGKTTADLMDQGISPIASVILGSSIGTGQFANDALMFQGLLESGAKKAATEATGAITSDELRTAHEFLGNPKTMTEAKANYLKIQKEFHPDITGGNDTIVKQANNAWAILQKEGIPGAGISGKVNKMPKQAELPPKLLEETNQHLAEHGPDVVHQALQDRLGATPEQASHIIKTAQDASIVEARTAPEKAISEIVAKHVPPEPRPVESTIKPLKGIVTTPDLRTFDFNELEGKPQTKELNNQIHDQIVNHPEQPMTKGGESFNQAADRGLNTVKEIINKEGNIGITTHNSMYGLIKLWDEKGRPEIIDKAFREAYTKQDNHHPTGDSYVIKGPKGDVVLMRHGETEDNVAGNFRHSDTQLTNKGIKQAEALRDEIKDKGITKIYSSDLPRAVHTSNIVMGEEAIKPEEKLKAIERHGQEPSDVPVTAKGEIAGHKVFSYIDKFGKTTVADVRTGLMVGTSKYKVGKRAIEDVKKQLLDRGDEEDLKKAFEEGHKRNEQINLQSGFINPEEVAKIVTEPVKVFLKEDVLPKSGAALDGFKNTMDGFIHAVAPTVGVKPTDLDQIMKMKGAQNKAEYIFAKTTETIKKTFDNMSQQENIDFIDRMKTGQKQPTESLQKVADSLREIDTRLWNDAKEFKPSLAWKQDHFRVMWKVVPGEPKAYGFRGIFNRPLQGTKGFTKQSTLVDMSEGLKKGGIPITYNPIEMFQYAYADMNKFITAHKMIEELKQQGQMKFYKSGQFPNNGYVKLHDNIAKVYMPVETATGGIVVSPSGEWYIEPNVGRILNNYLSKDLIRSSDLGRGMLAIKNVYTAVELSLSPFHAVFESLEAMGSQIGLGIGQISTGQFKKGLTEITKSPIAPYSTAKLGADAIKFITMTGPEGDAFRSNFLKKYPDAGQLMDDLFSAGGRLKLDDAYRASTSKTFKKNLQSNNYIGATLRAVPTLSETLTKPLFDIYIPRLKVGTFLKEYSQSLVENSKALAEGTVTRETLARETWNFVEDRFGEMNFDNLFWNKTFKTSMQVVFRSVTWKLGNLRATGGALFGQGKEFYDSAAQKRAPRINPKMRWLIGMSVITTVIGYTMQKVLTGKNPQSVKDIIYPQIDNQGNRVSTPTYWKDVFHLTHDPSGYIGSSTSGMFSKIIDIWNNSDFYGVEITDPNNSFLKHAEDNMVYLLPTPFAISSTLSLAKTGASKDKQAMSFLGFTKAPAYISQSEIQTKIYEVFQKRLGAGTISKEDADIKNQKSDIIKAYQSGNITKANELLKKAVADGVIKDVNAFTTKADYPGDIRAFRALPSNDQRKLIEGMSIDEIARYAWFVNSDVKSSFSEISSTAKDFVDQVNDGVYKEPVYSKGVIIQDPQSKPIYNAGDKTPSQGLLSNVVTYAKAIGTDPITAFHDIFHGQTIRKLTGDTIIVERMSLSKSSQIKKSLGGDADMTLDHTLPLELGGTNELSNLKLIPKEQAVIDDKVENYLGDKLSVGGNKKQIQKAMIDYKNNKITFDQIKAMFK